MMHHVYFILLACIFVSGCQTLNYDVAQAEITISNLVVREAFDLSEHRHEVLVSFDYEFTQNFTQANIYFCTVQFLGTQDGRSYSRAVTEAAPCQFSEDSGKVNFHWPTPFDGKNFNQNIIENLLLPMQYFVAVHQKTAQNKSNIIAYSQIFQSKN